MNKKINVSGVTNELEHGSAFFRRASSPSLPLAVRKTAQNSAQKVEQPFEQVSIKLSSESIENLAFRFRKASKSKVNTEVPIEWKEKFDDLAHELGVGKYELLMYIIGLYLGEVSPSEGNGQS